MDRLKGKAAIALALLTVICWGCAKGYEVTKLAGEYNVAITLDKNPPVAGENQMAVVVKDSSGRSVTDAKVKVDYSMPAMPGMPAANYSADVPLQGTEYKTTINLSMAGAWNIAVNIFRNDKTETVNFSVDVR
ncbi:MAG: FixH family protein [Syntrophales bacterium]